MRQQAWLQHRHVPDGCLAHSQQLGCSIEPVLLLLWRQREQPGQLCAHRYCAVVADLEHFGKVLDALLQAQGANGVQVERE